MSPHQAAGARSVATQDGSDDLKMILRRLFLARTVHERQILDAIARNLQRLQHPRETTVAAHLDDPAVQDHVLVHVPQRIAVQRLVRPALALLEQPVAVTRLARPRRAERRRQPLELLAYLEELGHVTTRHASDDRAALMAQLDIALGVEAEKGLADRAAADAKLGHQVRLDQSLAGRQKTLEDLQTDDLRGVHRGLGIRSLALSGNAARNGRQLALWHQPNSWFNAGRARRCWNLWVLNRGPWRCPRKSYQYRNSTVRPYSRGRATATSA